MSTIRLAHLSDPHLAAAPGWSRFLQPKRLLGRLIWLFNRARHHPAERLKRAVERLAAEPPDALLVSGDVGQLGLAEEFSRFRAMLSPLSDLGVPTYLVRGNHDCYGGHDPEGNAAFSALREEIMLDHPPESSGLLSLAGGEAEVLLLDSGIPTGLFSSGGHVSDSALAELDRSLEERPAPPLRIALGHHPFVTARGIRLPAACGLRQADRLEAFFRQHRVRLYLCGHIHHPFRIVPFAGCEQACAGSITSAGVLREIRTDRGGYTIQDLPLDP